MGKGPFQHIGPQLRTFTSRCTVIRTFLAIFPATLKVMQRFFLGYRGPYIGPTDTNHTKNFKQNNLCHFSRGVLTLGWGGMGVCGPQNVVGQCQL